jgi:hypothetical protein
MVMSSKYTIIKDKKGKSKKVVVEGVKKVLYKKDGNRKIYVVSKGKMMQLTKYKEMKKKQKSKNAKKSVKSKLNKKKKSRGGGWEYYDSKFTGYAPAWGKDWRKGDIYKTDNGFEFMIGENARSWETPRLILEQNKGTGEWSHERWVTKEEYLNAIRDNKK